MANFNIPDQVLSLLADDNNYTPSFGGFVFGVIALVGLWKVYTKAGQPGWAAIIPIYNIIVFLRIVRRPIWWILLLLIPIVNVVTYIVIEYELAKSFGKGVGFTILLIFLPFIGYPILGFGDAKYNAAQLDR